MNGHTDNADQVERIRTEVTRAAYLPGMIRVRQYVSNIVCLLKAYDAQTRELDREREAARANFEMYQRTQDENDRLTAELMALRREGKS